MDKTEWKVVSSGTKFGHQYRTVKATCAYYSRLRRMLRTTMVTPGKELNAIVGPMEREFVVCHPQEGEKLKEESKAILCEGVKWAGLLSFAKKADRGQKCFL